MNGISWWISCVINSVINFGAVSDTTVTEIRRWVTEWKSQQTTLAYISTPTALATLSNLRRPSQPPFSIVAILAFAAGNIVVGDVDCRRTQLVAAETQLLPAADARGATIEKGWLGEMSQIAEGGEGSRCVTGWKYKQESSAGFSIPLPISLSLHKSYWAVSV